jgi:hypothetical protein
MSDPEGIETLLPGNSSEGLVKALRATLSQRRILRFESAQLHSPCSKAFRRRVPNRHITQGTS